MEQRIQLLDYVRFAASLSVVAFHYLFNGITNGKISSLHEYSVAVAFAKYGYLGVELFFLISGYVIYTSASGKTADRFAVGRLVRLYPAFWFAVCFTSFFAIFWGGEKMSVSLPQFFASLTMVAPVFKQPFVDGVYWTLIFEIRFYLLVFALLFIGLSHKLDVIFSWWAILLFAVWLIRPELSSITYLGTYYAFFVGGAVLATIRAKGYSFLNITALASAFIVSLSFTLSQVSSMEARKGTDYSEVVIGLLIVSFYLLFFLLNLRVLSRLKLPFSLFLGGLAYPIYLLHAHFGYMVMSTFGNESNKWIVYALLLLIVVTVSRIVNAGIETRLKNYWYGFFDGSIGAMVRKSLLWKSVLLRKSVVLFPRKRNNPAPEKGRQ
ncbi:MAG: acyltransferase [Gammaproteobacteria bacterium]|nr:acyltransferase [Gammaproteobacteria bacterium]